MQYFIIALECVGIMLLLATPGFIFTKTKVIKQESISAFAKFLMYICQPCLTIYTFQSAIPYYSKQLLINMGWTALFAIVLELFILGVTFLACWKKKSDVRYRVMTLSSVLGNVGFLGVPLLEAMLPQNPEVVVYSAVFSAVMFFMVWTLGAFVITMDVKCIKPKNMLLNPIIFALAIALPLFFTRTLIPDILSKYVTLLGKCTTILCMLILGLRLGTIPQIKSIFNEPTVYISTAIKLLMMPILTFLLVYFLPLTTPFKQALVILTACPSASMVLNLAELYNQGTDVASKSVLACTTLSIATIPLIALLLPLL